MNPPHSLTDTSGRLDPMDILIIANRVGHDVQKPQYAEDDSGRAGLKQQFRELLRRRESRSAEAEG